MIEIEDIGSVITNKHFPRLVVLDHHCSSCIFEYHPLMKLVLILHPMEHLLTFYFVQEEFYDCVVWDFVK